MIRIVLVKGKGITLMRFSATSGICSCSGAVSHRQSVRTVYRPQVKSAVRGL